MAHRLTLVLPLLASLVGCSDRGGEASPIAADAAPEQAPRIMIHGIYRYMADAGSFAECFTNQWWPVAQVEDNAVLERAYLDAVREAGDPMLVHLEGRVVPQPAMEGDSLVPMLVVDHFLAVEPDGQCAPRYTTIPGDTSG
jgi:uncharacterized lipoprotein NlpE involved in copper resistance